MKDETVSKTYPPKFRERAFRLMAEVSPDHASEWAAFTHVARKPQVNPETLCNCWRKAAVDLLVGCSPTPSASPSSDSIPTVAVPDGELSQLPAEATDEAVCIAFGDVMTIKLNSDKAASEGRSTNQELAGWYRLITRAIHALPEATDPKITAAITSMKEVIPEVPLGAGPGSAIEKVNWESLSSSVISACDEAGFPVEQEMFTGG